MLTRQDLDIRRDLIARSSDLGALQAHLIERAAPLLASMPVVPQVKALLSRDGGVCPEDGSVLRFDPWSPHEHECPRCHRRYRGERHDAHWARAQHLWIAERAAHLAALHGVTGDEGMAQRARDLLACYYDLYFALPNADNVLGPSHLFFSTYLESIWLLDYFAAAFMLRESGALRDDEIARIDAIGDEAATIISEFNEGMSNRQTWHAAALTAIAVWFGDEDLAETAIEARHGLLGHLADGFGTDGMWHEGENYHLFALRGLSIGLQWARTAGAELLSESPVAQHYGQVLMATSRTALPDFTFPARKDSRFGVSLAHPAYLECWEAGLVARAGHEPPGLSAWLEALYQVPAREETVYDAYLHDAGFPLPPQRSRSLLSWWALLTMADTLPPVTAAWQGSSTVLPEQGIALLRRGDRYVALDGRGGGSGHGHPDRLQLLLHAGGVYWLPDPGTASYVNRDLFWYRSSLAHNAPTVGFADQAGMDGRSTAWQQANEWGWMAAKWNDIRRSVIVGPDWILDLVESDVHDPRDVVVPWHLAGEITVPADSSWQPLPLDHEFITDVTVRPLPDNQATRVTASIAERTIAVWFAGGGDLIHATAPGLPTDPRPVPFLMRRTRGAHAVMATLIDLTGAVIGVAREDGAIRVDASGHSVTVAVTDAGVTVIDGAARITLTGLLPAPYQPAPILREAIPRTVGRAVWVEEAPAADGSVRGFHRGAPLHLDEEHHYFRSESGYVDADTFSATAWVNWSDDWLFVAVEVTKADLQLRADDAAILGLDNEPEDINADSVQVYFRLPDRARMGVLALPRTDGSLTLRAPGDATLPEGATGAWRRTAGGYVVTLALPAEHIAGTRRNERIGFDLLINEMRPGRVRRAGQLIWSGGPGWVYLRGDRHAEEAMGELELLS